MEGKGIKDEYLKGACVELNRSDCGD